MIMFRNTDEELLTSISIRMSVVDFFDNAILPSRNLDLSKIQDVLGCIYTSQLPANIVGSQEKFAKLACTTSVEQLSLEQSMFFPPTQEAQNTELALFLMGMLHNTSHVSFETLAKILGDLTSEMPEDQKSPLIVRLRGTWLLEKVARNRMIFKE